jgi:phosphoribosylformimino-5-aminoimidazole carboxamide ribotide isomerase
MLIIPAIDLKDGKCVRLKQGDMEQATIYHEDPVEMARHWAGLGAKRIHVVDLNGAVAGKPKNEEVIKAIVAAVGEQVPLQLGGGIRDLDTIERYLDDGVSYVILGTAAIKLPGFMHDACGAFPGHIIGALDARDGKVAVDGWSKLTRHDAIDIALKYAENGVEAVIYTDIGRDGMLTGVNIESTVALARRLSVPVIASGGISDLKDIEALCKVEAEGVVGAVTGRALYQGTLDFAAAQRLADTLSGAGAA